jgi:hypothetical protein
LRNCLPDLLPVQICHRAIVLWFSKIQLLAFATQRCLLHSIIRTISKSLLVAGGDYAAGGSFWIHSITSGMQVGGYFGFNAYSR